MARYSAIHTLCQEHKLRYYLIGGGLIGAIRHGGPIPWDDDIDIGMPRADYERFLVLSRSIAPPYLVSNLQSDPDYIYGFAKCYDTDTTVTEDLAIRFTRGVWVDVFPIDGTFDNSLLRRLHVGICRGLKAVFASRCRAYDGHKQRWAAHFLRRIAALTSLPLSRQALHSLLHAALRLKDFEDSTYVGNLLGRWGMREICRASIFESQLETSFAGHRFMIPTGYHAYLTGVYGNYMELPSHERRVPDHSTIEVSLTTPFIHQRRPNRTISE